MSERRWAVYARLVPLIILAVLFALPLYVLVTGSLKSTADSLAHPFALPLPLRLDNYTTVFAGAGNQINFIAALFNSLTMTAISCAVLIALGSVAAYTLARNPGRLSNVLYLLTVVAIIIPSQLGIAPLYSWLRSFGLVGNTIGISLVYVLKQMPLTIFLFTGFFRQLPLAYEEAATIDGASRFATFTRVVMPQMRTITGTALLLNALYIWNDLFDQLVFLSGSRYPTLPVAVYTLSFGEVSQWNLIFAGVVISLVPMVVLYLFTQKQMMSSFAGGLK